ncbi:MULTISPECIES: TonB-dependent receptor [unclassified Pseudoalteromonas]|uniref:TonB-dependent receptor domain-containing protein n=1 Tax=unclassified Pseudoalteromonas TaxID=194690 RepID=UPI0025B33513|nr:MULTISPECIES: TonB-dependent receptor [unclassified Pseudoalteromonas]MDN3378654.1 TonB-dependent receptor [Pseudoalteromonas sp. APC 3893]MDN3387143.1 TonB-dependent receptor [Pseudoalteromonas sp. APC 4017]
MRKNKLYLAVHSLITISALVASHNLMAETKSKADDLEHIVITATGREQMLVDAPASISIITREEIEGKAYRDITDALQGVPGVSIEGGPGRKGGTAEISIRGMSSDYTLILVNGKAQGSSQSYYNGVGGGAETGWLPPISAIDRIEVVRGPMSSLYGSDALGGVVNVITRKVSSQWNGSVGVETVNQSESESGDSHTYRYYASGSINEADTLGLTVFGSYFNREEDSFANGYKDHANNDLNTKLYWKINEGNELEFSAGYSERASFGTAEKSGESSLDTDRRYYTLSHDFDWGKDNFTQTYAQNEVMHNLTQDSRYERTTVNSQSTIPLKNQYLTLGAQYRSQEAYHPTRAINLDLLERWDSAIFIEDEWSVSRDFSLTGGLRYSDDEKYGGELTPRLYAVYHLADGLTFKGGISTGYKTPDLKEGDSNWVEGGGGRNIDGADVGNDDLMPETSTSYEASLMWSVSRDSNLSITVYQTDYDDKISKNVICEESSELAKDCVYQDRGYQRVYQYVNEDSAELKGIEAAFSVYFDNIKTSFSYTYNDTEITSGDNQGEPLNNQPKEMFNATLDWQVSNKFNLWTRVNYKSETSEIGAGQYPDYTLADAGVSYGLSDSLRVYGGIYNLMNKEIRYEEYGKTLDGRRFNLGLQLEF